MAKAPQHLDTRAPAHHTRTVSEGKFACRHALVYKPSNHTVVPLRELPADLELNDLSFLGAPFSSMLAQRVCGWAIADPRTVQPWQPENQKAELNQDVAHSREMQCTSVEEPLPPAVMATTSSRHASSRFFTDDYSSTDVQIQPPLSYSIAHTPQPNMPSTECDTSTSFSINNTQKPPVLCNWSGRSSRRALQISSPPNQSNTFLKKFARRIA